MLPSPHATHILETAANSDLNGKIEFHYPSAIEQVLIGSRVTELINFRRQVPIVFEQLPRTARFFVMAVATLEHVVETAPRGWYGDNKGNPYLDPGAIGQGDEEAVLEVYQAYIRFRDGVQNAVREVRSKRQHDKDVVPGDEADRQPASESPDGDS